ncbi:MAG: gliding motility-associated C-terminal domain-containing protein [candidate division KSB1 bacterium]|nr:gliding motility-associated C-terminal domain-containing protein [candidate division KSB1 bacterium]MDZ7273940.1 gliding motility-associated C-terminal domain-containing protein [candidate division KSB1 bacterium]MDZ7286096.1 gliding motility-associated C-terminal domain-containing protein [candidate division KSB1 bacterium]MDZ7299128.1 gliding motility-associated C-terminal domain-containing protein [candidate division KSB1 bacterium]MDZ7306675.1 gliding motility-associated C-terminal domai
MVAVIERSRLRRGLAVALVAACAGTAAAFGPPRRDAGGTPPLLIQGPQENVLAGSRFRLSFQAGTATDPVNRLFGVGFELLYTNGRYLRLVDNSQAAGPLLEPNTYTFLKHEPERGLISLAVSRKLGATGVSGGGEILSLAFEVAADTPPGTLLCFSLGAITANDSAGAPLALQAGPNVCLTVADLSVEVTPNPFTPNDDGRNDRVEFRRNGGIPAAWRISILDRSARLVRRLPAGQNFWDGNDDNQRPVLPDIYLYLIADGETIVKRGVIALVR